MMYGVKKVYDVTYILVSNELQNVPAIIEKAKATY